MTMQRLLLATATLLLGAHACLAQVSTMGTTANYGCTVYILPTDGNLRPECHCRLDHPGAASSCIATATVAFDYASARTGPIDGTGHGLHVHGGHRSHDDVIDHDDAVDPAG